MITPQRGGHTACPRLLSSTPFYRSLSRRTACFAVRLAVLAASPLLQLQGGGLEPGQNYDGVDFSDRDLSGAEGNHGSYVSSNFARAVLTGADLSFSNLVSAQFSEAILDGANLALCDFADADLKAASLRFADLREAKIADWQLASARDLTGVNLSGNDLIGFNFAKLNLNSANLSFSDLRKANFENTNLENADLRETRIREEQLRAAAAITGINLAGTDLSRFRLSELNLTGASLAGCNLQGADFWNAHLQSVDLQGANITSEQLRSASEVTGINLFTNDLSGFSFEKMDLTGAVLANTRLRETRFDGANLAGVDLRGAEISESQLASAGNLTGVNLGGNDLREFRLDGLRLDFANFAGANLAAASLRSADLTGANFSNANLSDTNFRDANLEGPILDTKFFGAADFTGANLNGAALGDGTNEDGFHFEGNLAIGAASTTVNSLGQASLGLSTTLAGGALHAPNGLKLPAGRALSGFGTVDTPNTLASAVVLDGDVQASAGGLLFSGYVKGAGHLLGLVTFTGTYSPGNSPACVTVENLDLTSSSTLVLELGGLQPGTGYDQIKITGSATLDGTLQISLIAGFQPAPGDIFRLFSGTTRGTFATILLPALNQGVLWDTSDLTVNGSLHAVPEPGGAMLGGLGALMCWSRGRSRK